MQKCGPDHNDHQRRVVASSRGIRARGALRGIAILDYRAQNIRDLLVATRISSKLMACPIEGSAVGVKRVIRYLQESPSVAVRIVGDSGHGVVRAWTERHWVGDDVARRRCGGGYVEIKRQPHRPWEHTSIQCRFMLRRSRVACGRERPLGRDWRVRALQGEVREFSFTRDQCGCQCMQGNVAPDSVWESSTCNTRSTKGIQSGGRCYHPLRLRGCVRARPCSDALKSLRDCLRLLALRTDDGDSKREGVRATSIPHMLFTASLMCVAFDCASCSLRLSSKSLNKVGIRNVCV